MLECEISIFKRGQFFGFLIMVAVLIGSFYLILNGHKVDGYVAAATTILFYFGSVIYKNKVQKQKQLEQINQEEV